MKKYLLLLFLLACLCLSSCQLMDDFESSMTDSTLAIVADKAEETGAATLARQFVDGLLAEDADMCLAAMAPGVTMEALQTVFGEMCAMLPDVAAYTLTPTYWSSSTNNGETQNLFQFRLEAAEQTFLLQTVQVSSMERLYNIRLVPWEELEEAAVQEQPDNALGPVSLLLTVATFGVSLWALIDCARHKLHHKWLWILLILFANLLLTFTLSGSRLNLQFNVGLYLVSSQLISSTSGFALRLLIPVGAIIYLIRRKTLTAQTNTQASSDESTALPENHPETENASLT